MSLLCLANPTGCHKMSCVPTTNIARHILSMLSSSTPWCFCTCPFPWMGCFLVLFFPFFFTWLIPAFLAALKASTFSFEKTSQRFLSRARHFLLSWSLYHTSFCHASHNFCDPELDPYFLECKDYTLFISVNLYTLPSHLLFYCLAESHTQ